MEDCETMIKLTSSEFNDVDLYVNPKLITSISANNKNFVRTGISFLEQSRIFVVETPEEILTLIAQSNTGESS